MGKVLFMIINNEVRFNMNGNQDHREWYLSLGLSPDFFDMVIRGFILDNKIIYYKGSNFQYDGEVLKAAQMYTPYIRFSMQKNDLEAYCGISFTSPTEWEPIVKIEEKDITGIPSKQEVLKEEGKEVGPLIELKNDYQNDTFLKTAIIVTIGVLVITLINKIILFQQHEILKLSNPLDVLLAIAQIGLLGVTIYSYSKKKEYGKYIGFLVCLLLIFTFNLVDVLLGVLYFLFCIDQNYFMKAFQFIKNKIKGQKSS